MTIQKLYSKIKTKYEDFDISVGYLAEVIRDNNFTRKRTKTRHYLETRYNKPINFVKELEDFYKKVGKFKLNKIIIPIISIPIISIPIISIPIISIPKRLFHNSLRSTQYEYKI